MAVTISNVYIETFERNVRHLAQQGIARLRQFVTSRGTTGEKHNWETLSAGAAVEKTAVLVTTPAQELPWARRVSIAETWHAGEATEQEDPVQMLIDPNSAITMNLAMSMNRAVDDIIIAAATGTALDGLGANNAFPAGQVVGDGTAAISFDFVTQVQEAFMANDIMPDVPKCMVVGPVQVRQLMNLTEMTSKDFVARGLDQLSSTGIVPNWLGFTWIVSTRLLAPSVGELSCLAFTKRALGLQLNRDITCRVAEDPSVSFAWRLYCHMTMGSVRVEDEHIVHLHVLDS